MYFMAANQDLQAAEATRSCPMMFLFQHAGITKRMAAIGNLAIMDIFCSDKSGTFTFEQA
jgi:magnesium-transporting ATPase (P-type)